ncbi:unnamed protein product [Urochloa humidicola]
MALQRLIDKCHYLFDGSNVPPTADVVSIICGMIDKIGPDDVALMDDIRFSNEINATGCQEPPIITFKTIYECDNFTITVFLLPQGAAMPLHDHPGMTVFSKLLIGSTHVVSYDWVHPRVCTTAAAGSVPEAMLAQKVLDNEFTAASGAWVLFPDAGGNLHRIVTGEDGPCALLDVITPPYSPTSETQQRFAFYKDIPYELHPNVNDGEVAQEQKGRLAWLQEIDEPEDLRLSNLPYQGPPVV